MPYLLLWLLILIFVLSCDIDARRGILEEVKKDLPEDVYEYYRRLLEFIDAKKASNLNSLYKGKATFVDKNIYLDSDLHYKILQERLREVPINLHFGNAKYISNEFGHDYDIILLSNIADYFGTVRSPMKLKEFEKFIRTYYNLLAKNGLLINYLYLGGPLGEVCMGYSSITSDDLG